MPAQTLPLISLLTFAQSSVYAQQMDTPKISDDFGTSIVVYLLIIAVYGVYWFKRKT